MAEAILDLRLDTVQPNRVRLVYGVQNDYNSRYICARFTASGTPIALEKAAAVRINAKRPDGNKDAFPGTVNADGTAKVPVAQWMLEVPGEVSASITAVTTGGALTTQEFYIMAKASIWDSTGEPSAENPDKDVLQTIIASENERVAAESTRVANENARKSAETARATAETKRIADEATRVVNEAGRVSAEEIRREEFATWQDEWGKISSFDKRLENLAAAVSPGLVTPTIDDTIAYRKTVPNGVLPNAAVCEVGGMSYVKNGVLVDSKVEAIESVGTNLLNTRLFLKDTTAIKENDDGSFTITNKTSTDISVNQSLTRKLPAGTYTIKNESSKLMYVMLDVTDYSRPIVNGEIKTFTYNGETYLKLLFADFQAYESVVVKIMLNRGSTILPYSPYFRETLPIPADALDGWGQGVTAQCYNKIVLDPLEGVEKYVKKANKFVVDGSAKTLFKNSGVSNDNNYLYYISITPKANIRTYPICNRLTGGSPQNANYVGWFDHTSIMYFNMSSVAKEVGNNETAINAWLVDNPLEVIYELAASIETDVSHLFTDDNLLPVEAGGTITAVNEYEQAVPFTIEYTVKGA